MARLYDRKEIDSLTAFRSDGNDIAIPISQQIYGSLWQMWNVLCTESMQVDDLWPQFAVTCILVNELTATNTVRWESAEGTRGAAIGFKGTIGFPLMPRPKFQENWKPFWDGPDAVMQFLSKYAFHCGVEHPSTVGMGQTRVLSDRKSDHVRKGNPTIRRVRK